MKTTAILAGIARARMQAEGDVRWAMSHARPSWGTTTAAQHGWARRAALHQETVEALDAARDIIELTEGPLGTVLALARPVVRVAARASDAVDRALAVLLNLSDPREGA